MQTQTTQARNWNDLSSVIDVANLDSSDEKCLAEIQSVIERYSLTDKFGVALLHKHFLIDEDEMLVERNYSKERRLVTSPEKALDVKEDDLITTIWRFDNGVRYGCSYCNKDHCTS